MANIFTYQQTLTKTKTKPLIKTITFYKSPKTKYSSSKITFQHPFTGSVYRKAQRALYFAQTLTTKTLLYSAENGVMTLTRAILDI